MKISALFLLSLVNIVTAQPLDWSGELAIFGTVQNEHSPCVAIAGPSVLQAFCIVADDTLAMKRSSNSGESWSAVSKLVSAIPAPRLMTASDYEFTYAICSSIESSSKHLCRFAANANLWSDAVETELPLGFGANVDALSAATDASVQPDDPYLNVCWKEGANEGAGNLWFVQSQDQGITFSSPVLVHAEGLVTGNVDVGVAIATTWSGEEENIHIASTQDREGSIPQEIKIYSSSNQGLQWNTGISVDAAAYAQFDPSLTAFGNNLFLVYMRRSDVTSQRDIYFVYSPDEGVTFSDPVSLTPDSTDDASPQIVMDVDGEFFYVFYLTGEENDDHSTLMFRRGAVAAPWVIDEAAAICENEDVFSSGGYAITSGSMGIAATWTSEFVLGDQDVHFDASWRGTSIEQHSAFLPIKSMLGECYPNPFNGSLSLPLDLHSTQTVTLVVLNMLGQRVQTLSYGPMTPGSHILSTDLRNLSSGTYYFRLQNSNQPPIRAVLIK